MNSNYSFRLLFSLIAVLTMASCGSGGQSGGDPSASSWQIEPRVGVGKIASGMTLADVEKILGKSEDPLFGSGKLHRIYRDYGISLRLRSDGSNSIRMVMCGSDDPTDVLAKSSQHRTKENVGVGSSRSEVIAAYGQPDTTKTDWMGKTPEEGLFYDDSVGLRFLLSNNKVHQVLVILE